MLVFHILCAPITMETICIGRGVLSNPRVNGMHNGVASASGLSGNDIRQDGRIRRVIIKLGGEGVRVCQALGYKLEDIGGQDAEKLARASEGDRVALDEVESLMLGAAQLTAAQRAPA